jgi:hypothetical protein
MHATGISFIALLIAGVLAAEEKPRAFTFSKGDIGKVPSDWKAEQTGKGDASVWKVLEDKTAPSKSGYALAQTATSPNATFNLCVATDTNYLDVDLAVSFKANEGKNDQGGGLVWRYQDANNYYLSRMNPLEDNFRVYKVVDGKRSREFQNAEVRVPAGEWHILRVKMIGDHIECFLDAKKHLDVKDGTFTKPGKIGLWTKADARTSFDLLTVTRLSK